MSIENRIDQLCDKFEAAWNAGKSPTVGKVLEQIPAKHHAAILDRLIPVDVELRMQAGQAVVADDYAAFGPTAMDLAKRTIEKLTPPADPLRASDEWDEHTILGPGDEHSTSGDLTESQILDSFHKVTRPQEVSPVIGPYKILQKIAEGGMGIVFMAEQTQPVRRRVALKLIKAGLDSKDVITRFEAERQALALMDHPNIARVLDAGTTKDGRPYFVMELVQGIPVTEYCDKQKLSIEDRLELFTQTCRAIQHAHQKGIIHRDIKPSNVLVTQHDGVPSVKVIDFGLAKALQSATRLTDKTMFTEFGQVVGTLQYMSPEQAEMNALDVDTRSDVYSLGVLLYELLTGSTPIEKQRLKEMALDRILVAIREQEAPRPSIRLSSLGEQATSVSEQRKTDPRRLGVVLKGDLDWIAMKALEKDRTRRYDSPTQLAEDVSRFLKGDAIIARPPSFAYRISKTLRKNKAAAAVIAGALMLTSIAAVATTMLWLNLRDQQIAEADRKAEEIARIQKEALDRQERDQKAVLDAQERKKEAEDREKETKALLELAENEKKRADEKAAEAEDEREAARTAAIEAQKAAELARTAEEKAKEEQTKATLAADAEKKAAQLAEQRSMEAKEAAELAKAAAAKAIDEEKKAVAAAKVARESEQKERLARTALLEEQETVKAERNKATAERDRAEAILARANYNLAMARWEDGRVMNAIELLQRIPPEHRNFEWYLARRDCEGYCVSYYGHEDMVLSVAFSPGGEVIASGSSDRTIRLWDRRTCKVIRTLTLEQSVSDIVFTPDGSRIVSAAGNAIQIWNASTGGLIRTMLAENYVSAIAISHDGTQLVSAESSGSNGIVTNWDLTTGAKITTVLVSNPEVDSVAFRHDGREFASGTSPITVWDSVTGVERQTFDGYGYISFSPDGTRLVAGGAEAINIWDVASGELRASIGRTDILSRVILSPDGGSIASARFDGTIEVLDLETGQVRHRLVGHLGRAIDLDFSPDGSHLASAGHDGSVKLWPLDRAVSTTEIIADTTSIESLAVSPDSRLIVSGAADGKITKWDSQTLEVLDAFEGHNGEVTSLAFQSDGMYFASSSSDETIRIWSISSDRSLDHVLRVDEVCSHVSFNLDERRIAGEFYDSDESSWSCAFWDVQSGKRVETQRRHRLLRHACSTNSRKELLTWNVEEIEIQQLKELLSADYSEAYLSRDGTRIAAATGGVSSFLDGKWITFDTVVTIWDKASASEVCRLRGHEADIVDISFARFFTEFSG